MSYGDLRPFATRDALQLLNGSKGGAYFIPEGFEPILVAHDELTDEVRSEIRRSTAQMRVPTMLSECRLPSYIVTGRVNSLLRAQPSFPAKKNPPRPPNAFILYRKSKQAEIVSMHRGILNNDVSRIIGQMWKCEAEETKKEFQRAAESIKAEHKLMYPNYRYSPRKQPAKNLAQHSETFNQVGPTPLRLQPSPDYLYQTQLKIVPCDVIDTGNDRNSMYHF